MVEVFFQDFKLVEASHALIISYWKFKDLDIKLSSRQLNEIRLTLRLFLVAMAIIKFL